MMKKIFLVSIFICIAMLAFIEPKPNLELFKETSIDSLGACQGISYQNGAIFLYGDREVGIIRKYKLKQDTLSYQQEEYKLTVDGKDVINHPTGFAYHPDLPTFIGNSVRLDPEGKH